MAGASHAAVLTESDCIARKGKSKQSSGRSQQNSKSWSKGRSKGKGNENNGLPYGFTQGCGGCVAAKTSRAPEILSEACRQQIESAMEADDVERARVEVNRRAREEAGAARQPRTGGPEHLLIGEATTCDDDADVGWAAGGAAPVAGGVGSTASRIHESSSTSMRFEGSAEWAAGGTGPTVRGAESAVPRANEAMPELSSGEAAGSAAPRSPGAGDTAREMSQRPTGALEHQESGDHG